MNFDISTFTDRAKEIVDWLGKEFASIRTGESSASLLDGVRVDSYGAKMPLNQVGTVGVEDARTLRVSVWDASQVAAVERAILDANLGLSVVTDSSGLRVIFPELTGERRTQLVKVAKNKHEEARVSLRNARDEIMKQVEKAEKDGELSEDEKFRLKESIQKEVDAANNSLDSLYSAKEKNITSI